MKIDYAEFLTQDGRWKILQDWLREKPRNKRKLEKWLKQTPEESWPEMRVDIADYAERHDSSAMAVVIKLMPLTPLVRTFIEEAKHFYIDRKAFEKEKTHGARTPKTTLE